MANASNPERSALDFMLERLIWLLAFAAIAVGPLATGLVRPQDFAYVVWLTLGATGVWALRIVCCQEHRVFWPPISFGVTAFMAYAAWCYSEAPVEYVARQELLRVLVYGALFLVFVANLHRQEAGQLVAFGLIFIAMGISLYALYQFLTKSEMVWWFTRPAGYYGRASGTYINPNHLAGFLEMVLPMGIALTLAGRYSMLMKVLLGYATLVILAGLVLTISRGGWIAATIGCGFLFVFWLLQTREYWLPTLSVGLGLAVAAGVAFSFARQADVRQNRLSEVRVFNDVRYLVWPAAISIWKEHPWTGGGPAHFDLRFPKYRAASDQLSGRPERTHNDYLNTLADWGVIGLGLIATCLTALAWGFVKGWRYLQRSSTDLKGSKLSNRAAVVLGAASGLVAISIHSLCDFNMHIPANALVAVSLMGLVSGSLRYATDRYWVRSTLLSRGVITLLLLAWCIYITPQAIRLTHESRELAKVAAIKVADQPRLNHLIKAFEIENRNAKTAFEIGDHYWRTSSEGVSDYQALAKEAIAWFETASRLNPLDPTALIRHGMCLDWLDKPNDARPLFERALELDPNGFNTVAHMGWHLFQIGQYAEARKWFEKSQSLYATKNPMAKLYLDRIDQKLSKEAK